MALIAELLLVCSATEAEPQLQAMLNMALGTVLPLAQALDSTDTGVVFMFWRVGDERFKPLVTLSGGVVPPEKRQWYTDNAARKLDALARNPEILSTFEVADESIELFGGGVQLRKRVALISAGLAPHFDEMLVCLMAYRAGLSTLEEVRGIAEISNNPHLRKYLERIS